jgi:hypothetical protein
MNRDPRFALSQELEAKQTLLDQLHALAVEDPDFLTDLLEGETNLLELIAALDASVLDDETLADGEDHQALITWRERNRYSLREFWARAPADALGVKQECEKALAQT